jgi:CRP-like cAMP-binding protein
MGSPSFFGEMAILDHSHRVTDVIALTSVDIVSLPARSFTQLLLSEAKVSYKLAQIMAQRLRQTNQLFYLKDQSVAVKIVYILVQLAESYGQKTDQKVELFRISLEDLASLAQVSLEDVKLSMDRFLKQGLIQVDPSTQTLVLNNYAKFLQATQVI